MPETTFAKQMAEGEIETLAKKQALMMLARMQGITEEEMKSIFRSKRASTPTEEVKVLEEITQSQDEEKRKKFEKKTQTNSCADGLHCQRVVLEDELPGLLAQGWRVAAVLPSGKIVVGNEN
jgi:hypothetical protein